MTRVRGGTAHAVDRAIDAVRIALGADDVVLDPAPYAGGPTPPGSVDLTARGSATWRLSVVRSAALDDRERSALVALAAVVADALGAAEDGALEHRLGDLVDATLLRLDSMPGAAVEERLAKVARDLAEVVDARGWSVRLLVDGDWMLVAHDNRRGALADPEAGWAPLDPRVLDLDEGSVAVGPSDDSTVSDALRHCELTSLVAATGYDPDAVSWTVCLVGDDVSGDLGRSRTALAALVPAALGFPTPPRSGGLLRSVG